MSTSRLFVGLAAAFFASGVSVDPDFHALTPRPRTQIAVRESVPAALPAIEATDAPAPRDLTVEILPDARGGQRVALRRPGFLVSLRHEEARAAGADWASMRVEPRPGKGEVQGRLIWETTRLDTLETNRGLVMLGTHGGTLAATLSLARAPEPSGAAWKSPRGSCAGQHDGLGGFTVLCRFARDARGVGAVNVTGAHALDDTWLVPGPTPVVRLDLARSPDGAEARVLGFSQGATGVVVRVEASFAEGEPAALLIEEAKRTQPVPLL